MVSDTTPISVWGGCDLAKNALQDGTGTKEQAVEAGWSGRASRRREALDYSQLVCAPAASSVTWL